MYWLEKKGKLPFETVSEDYSLEYGKATIEVHVDSVDKEDRIAVVDDLIATGGTLLAASKLFQRLGAAVVEVTAVIDLPELGGFTITEYIWPQGHEPNRVLRIRIKKG